MFTANDKSFMLDYPFCLNSRCPGKVVEKDEIGNETEIRPAALDYVEINDFYQCPYCGFEAWMAVDKRRGKKISTRDAQWALKDERVRQGKIRKKTSSSSPKSRKEPPKYYPPGEQDFQ